ncbi:uncharacterized protein LOC134844796 [Symsagittifera roscoffensis]|uniref:uncharacterized protein LOC134844796 n=1 Tax=Symsagittifera roscoffensis TaxID=84072 RepID=UPI00307BB849
MASRVELLQSELAQLEKELIPNYYLTQLEHLDLSNNQISVIEADTFVKFYKLKSLYLSGNSIQHLDFFIPKTLEILDVSKNILTSVKGHFLNSTTKIRSLDLSSNMLSKNPLDKNAFEGIRTREPLNIDLSNNNLITLSQEAIWPLLTKNKDATRYEKLKLNLNANNIHCNCMLNWIPQAMSMEPSEARFMGIDIQGRCNSPNNLESVSLHDLKESQLSCVGPTIVLPNKNGFSDVTWREGEDGSVRCSASGDPNPRYAMVLNHKNIILPSKTVGRYILSENGNLVVKELRLSDKGNITCVAENVAGSATHVINVHVAPHLTGAQKAAITFGILIPVLVVLISVICGVCIYWYFKRGKFAQCTRKRRSSSIGEEAERFSLQNHHKLELNSEHNTLRVGSHDPIRADSLTYLDYATGGRSSPIESRKPMTGNIHQAFVNGMRQSIDKKSRTSSNRSKGDDLNKSHPSVYDLHSTQYAPCFRDDPDSCEQINNIGTLGPPVLAFARKSNTMPKMATINHMGTFNVGGPRQDNGTLPTSQSNPGKASKTQSSNGSSVGVARPMIHNGNGDLDDGVLSRPSSTNSSNYSASNHTQQPYLSIKRGSAMPTVPAKLYAIPLYIDPPQFKSNVNGSNSNILNSNSPNMVSPGSTTSEATHMS